MRILQVVSILSPDGAFGGPARVALNQCAELIRRGHDVTLAAGGRGYATSRTDIDGVPVRLFGVRTVVPFTGFPGMAAPGLVRWVRPHLDGFDVIHIHFGRDLMVLPVAAVAQRRCLPYVLQTHGMVTPSANPLAGPLDALWTRRILRDAGAVMYLTDRERGQLVEVAGDELRLIELPNGVPRYPARPRHTGRPEVLYLARLDARKRPVVFVEAARRLLADGVRATFTLVGPDEGEGPAVRAAIAGDTRITWEGPIEPHKVAARMARASVYVLPADREPYPMAVLEAMSVGLPVVVCADCGLAPVVAASGGGIVADGSVTGLATAVATVLTDPDGYGARARAAAGNDFAMTSIGDRLLAIYRHTGGRM